MLAERGMPSPVPRRGEFTKRERHMAKSIYLVAPKSEMPHNFGGEVFEHWGFAPVQWIGDAALATVAALAPPEFDVRLCDETVTPVDLDDPADFIGITGKISQRKRMLELARVFRERGKTVLIGGPSASLAPEVVRESCDILVRGELEDIAPELFADLGSGRWKDEYAGEKPDLQRSPIPRWDLYPNDRTITGALQTSRGCPFVCEFCDVIQYLGRKQRRKRPGQVLEELDALYGYGYRDVFLTDDNFTVYRSQAKELLAALGHWNENPDRGPVFFATQASIDAARDEELLRMCGEAGLTVMFVGIETPNEAGLLETKKHQNLLDDPLEQIQRFLDHGILVLSGMMVGFDADGPDIFERQFDFAMSSQLPLFSLGAVVAPEATPLHARMRDSERLIEGGDETAATPWVANIVPAGMTCEQMSVGMRWLANRLYHLEFFGERIVQFIESFRPSAGGLRIRDGSRPDLNRETGTLLQRFLRSGPEEMKTSLRVERALARKASVTSMVQSIMVQYAQIRCLYERAGYWDPALGRLAAPPF